MKDVKLRIWVIGERPPEPQPKPQPPQPSPSPPVPREGVGALCQVVTGECTPPSVRNVFSQCGWSYSQLKKVMGLLFIRRLFSFCAAEDVLDFFRDSFIKWMDASTVLHELRHRNIISDGDLAKITGNPDTKQQNEILHRHLKRSCDEEALMEVCDMMIAVDGNRRMNALGQKMKCKLEGKKIVQLVVCVC